MDKYHRERLWGKVYAIRVIFLFFTITLISLGIGTRNWIILLLGIGFGLNFLFSKKMLYSTLVRFEEFKRGR